MKTPLQTTFRQFGRECETQTGLMHQDEHGIYRCVICESQIHEVRAYLSVHTEDFDMCAGSGKVWRFGIKYCPTCEPKPEEYGCVHVPYGWLRVDLDDLIKMNTTNAEVSRR